MCVWRVCTGLSLSPQATKIITTTTITITIPTTITLALTKPPMLSVHTGLGLSLADGGGMLWYLTLT
jgi:hypothetical protein